MEAESKAPRSKLRALSELIGNHLGTGRAVAAHAAQNDPNTMMNFENGPQDRSERALKRQNDPQNPYNVPAIKNLERRGVEWLNQNPELQETTEGRDLKDLLFEVETARAAPGGGVDMAEYAALINELTLALNKCETRLAQVPHKQQSLTRIRGHKTEKLEIRGLLELAQTVTDLSRGSKERDLESRIRSAASWTRETYNIKSEVPVKQVIRTQYDPLRVWHAIFKQYRASQEYMRSRGYQVADLEIETESARDIAKFQSADPDTQKAICNRYHVTINNLKVTFTPALEYKAAQGREVPAEFEEAFLIDLYDTFLWILNTPTVRDVIDVP